MASKFGNLRIWTDTSFGNNIEPGKIYGMGEIRSRLTPTDVIYDDRIDEICIRKHGSNDPWQRTDDSNKPRYIVPLNDDLTEITIDPEENAGDESAASIFEAASKRLYALHSELEQVERELCARFNCEIGDGSELAEFIFEVVHNPDNTEALQNAIFAAEARQLADIAGA